MLKIPISICRLYCMLRPYFFYNEIPHTFEFAEGSEDYKEIQYCRAHGWQISFLHEAPCTGKRIAKVTFLAREEFSWCWNGYKLIFGLDPSEAVAQEERTVRLKVCGPKHVLVVLISRLVP